jgi:hypothetical protein
MSVINVYQPSTNKTDNTGQRMQQIGGLISMIPHPAAQAAGGGLAALGTIKQMTTQQPKEIGQQGVISSQQQRVAMPSQTPRAAQAELDMPDYSSALNRRTELAQNADQELIDARAALEALDMDQELKTRLQKPLEAAIAAQRSIG